MPEIFQHRVEVLPLAGIPNHIYYIPNGQGTDVDQYIVDNNGNYHKVNPVGSGTSSYEEITEELIGVINGVNNTFTTSFNFDPSKTIVWINGVKQKKVTHYNTIGNTIISFMDSPLVGEILEINYVKI